jgi:decaprenyl-phosphate phosphoribosyltransferase
VLILRGMRPQQWTKNLFVFAAPAAAGVLGHWQTSLRLIVACLAFCLAASGTYLVNDVVDAPNDRRHPVKCSRPVASGALKPGTALGVGAVLLAAGIVIAALLGPWSFGLVIAVYVAVNVAYSLRLKREPVVELAIVASGFVLRAVGGGVVARVPLTNWFLVFISFGALFVVTGKRAAEYMRLGDERGEHRPVLALYTESFLRSTLVLAATVTVAAYCLWAFDRSGLLSHAGHHVVWVELTVVPLVLAVLHVLRRLDAAEGGEPDQLFLHDHLLQSYAIEWAILMCIGLYA